MRQPFILRNGNGPDETPRWTNKLRLRRMNVDIANRDGREDIVRVRQSQLSIR